jgi:transposase
MRHISGDSRQQVILLPDTLDDYVDKDHPVRVIDAFVDTLDMKALGFSKAETQITGRKPYHPGDLLKLYVYGYLNQTRSSRRLEKECHRNLELLWLMRRLAPDFKTISDFRKENGGAVRGACRAFIQFCRQADLLTGRLVAVDGSNFKAAASNDSVIRRAQLPEQRRRIDHLIDHYLQQLDQADADDQHIELESASVEKALEQLQQEKIALDNIEAQMDERGRNQACLTEPDAKLMRSGREGMVVGYNVQSAVDADSGLIIHHEVTDEGDDRRQLYPMARQTKAELGQETLDVLADGGYSNGEQLAACDVDDITVTLPIHRSINDLSDAYPKSAFTYDADRDCYICPGHRGATVCDTQADYGLSALSLLGNRGCQIGDEPWRIELQLKTYNESRRCSCSPGRIDVAGLRAQKIHCHKYNSPALSSRAIENRLLRTGFHTASEGAAVVYV